MNRTKTKLLLAFLLCVWMTVNAMLPVTALATEGGQTLGLQETTLPGSDDTIILTEDGALLTSGQFEDDEVVLRLATDSDGDRSGDGIPVEEEPPNTDIKVIPSDANALVLMDSGAQSPKGVPGNIVTVVLTMAVNKEYLPSERYMLRNIHVTPDIPTDASVSNWPFDIINASETRHLDDMSYNSTADVYYDFRISEFAKKGVYPVNFKVNATVWRYDDVNGTSVTEDVTFPLCVYVTVVDDGSLSGVTTAFGCLQVAGSNEDGTYTVPTGTPNQGVSMRVPVKNVGGSLTNVTVYPVVSVSLDEFPFVATTVNYNKFFSTWNSGEIKYLDYYFTISPHATSGNKAIKFKASYYENSAPAEATFSTQITIIDGYDAAAMSVMVKEYKLFVEDTEVSGLMAGEETELQLTLVNNSRSEWTRKVVASLEFANCPGLVLCAGSTDSAYVDSIAPGDIAVVKYKVMAKQDAEVGPAVLGIKLNYETTEAVAGTANQNIMLTVSQKMELLAGEPSVYGTPTKDKDTTISLTLTNLGRGKILNIRVLGKDGIKVSVPCYVGDLLAGGSTSADVTVGFSKLGKFTGKLVIQYEDANGQSYTQDVPVLLNVTDPAAEKDEVPVVEDKENNWQAWWLWLVVVLLVLLITAGVWYLLHRRRGKRLAAAMDSTDDFDNDAFDTGSGPDGHSGSSV